MTDEREKERKEGVSRRDFMKGASAGAAALTGLGALRPGESRAGSPAPEKASAIAQGETEARRPSVNREAIIFAIGDTLIPSEPGDPGYRDLEWYGITQEISRRLADVEDAGLNEFDQAGLAHGGKTFTSLNSTQREEFVRAVLRDGGFEDAGLQARLREVFNLTREAVMTVYYQNFPQHGWPRDANRVPLLKPDDQHQITNPNTEHIYTGWDRAGFAGPLTFEEEEKRRNFFKRIRWEE